MAGFLLMNLIIDRWFRVSPREDRAAYLTALETPTQEALDTLVASLVGPGACWPVASSLPEFPRTEQNEAPGVSISMSLHSSSDAPQTCPRATAALDALTHSLQGVSDSLPMAAVSELGDTIGRLRAVVDELVTDLQRLSKAPVPSLGEHSWAQERLTRLETLARGGTPMDEAERAQLVRTLEEAEQAQVSADAVEARRIGSEAQLVEITLAAERLHRELLVGLQAGDAVQPMLCRLDTQTRAALQARAELAACYPR
jgi:hypothetical protein